MAKENISLNFLRFNPDSFSYNIYRKLRPPSESEEELEPKEAYSYKLPLKSNLPNKTNNEGQYKWFWVKFSPTDGYEEFNNKSHYNINLTKFFLYKKLAETVKENIDSKNYIIDHEGYRNRIFFNLKVTKKGNQTVWIEPYFLKNTQKRGFGILLDFKFLKKRDVEYNREVQKLSLSLDKNYKENTNFYVNKHEMLQEFLNHYYHIVSPLRISQNSNIDLKKKLTDLPLKSLKVKTYTFANGREHKSQFKGLEKNEPLSSLDNPKPNIFFIYQEQTRPFANDLYKALVGKKFSTFSGVADMFGFEFSSDKVKGIKIENFSQGARDKIVENLSNYDPKHSLPIVIIPWKKGTASEEESRKHYRLKYRLLENDYASQFVSKQTISDNSKFKWSVSGIALQIFTKLGGIPWKVEARTRNCLIAGIGQRHKYQEGSHEIKKYFSYSVLTDSSGIYKRIEPLGYQSDKSQYLKELKSRLVDIMREYKQEYSTIVLHTPKKIKKDSMKSIYDALDNIDANSSKFAVLKINQDNKFFGYQKANNSFVPYESSYLTLGPEEFLVWYKGLQYHRNTVKERVPGPIHFKFTFSRGFDGGMDINVREDFLQDAINLSGANWRGFNAKSLPISILYSRLFSKFIGEFFEEDYDVGKLEKLKPWFL